MKKHIAISVAEPQAGCAQLVETWANPAVKVVVAQPDRPLADVRQFYENLFPYLGKPAALAEDATAGDRANQRTGDIWMEIRFDPAIENAYRHSSNPQPLHTDGSYIPDFPNSSFLACVTNAGQGGETIFLDSRVLVEVLQQEAPELLQRLLSCEVPHERSGDRRSQPVLVQQGSNWLVNWNYYCVAAGADSSLRELVETFQHFLLNSAGVARHLVAVKLRPGEAVMWKDAEVLHGRNGFSAATVGERFIWKCAFDIGNFG